MQSNSRYVSFANLVQGWLVLLLFSGFANAQTIVYAEGFNTDGNGSRYTLIRDYYEVTQPNNLWTTVPNQLPGENVIVYLEPGDSFIDGTPVPARRATFFADNDLGDRSFGVDLTDEGFALFDASINWASNTDGSTPLNINYVIDDDSFEETNNLDVTLVDRLRDQGHSVEVTNADFPPDGEDLIFMASHDDGSAVGAMAPEFKDTTIPLVTGFFHAAAQLGLGSERGENTNGTYDLQIVDSAHPLAAGFPNGVVQVVDNDAARQRLTRVTRGTIAPDAKVVATLPGSIVDVPDDFTDFEGDGYLRGGHSTWNNAPESGAPRGWQTLEPIDTSKVENPRLVLDLAAMGDGGDGFGVYENAFDNPDNFDFIRILTDDDGDGEFDILTEFLAEEDFESDIFGFLASEDGTPLETSFQSFTFELPSTSTLGLRIDVFTNASDERIGIDNVRVIGDGVSLTGDFNNDGTLDAADIDLLTDALGGNDSVFDLNSDGTVTDADRTIWVVDVRRTWFGDANLDGEFSSADFVTVFTVGEYEDTVPGNSTWAEGDWNGDGDFTSGDFVRAFTDGGYEKGPRPMAGHAVPEPGFVPTLLILFSTFVGYQRAARAAVL